MTKHSGYMQHVKVNESHVKDFQFWNSYTTLATEKHYILVQTPLETDV